MTNRTPDPPTPANLVATTILDHDRPEIRRLVDTILLDKPEARIGLRRVHIHLIETLRPIYSVNEFQPASVTLQWARGSCSQRMAALEAIARAAGIPTRVRALRVKGEFWFPRFRIVRWFIPDSVVLLWPQFFVGDMWLDFDELHAPISKLVATSDQGFKNDGESIFEAVQNTAIDFLGKSCGNPCARPQHNLSMFMASDEGLFENRDEALRQLGSFQFTLRGKAFELIYGGRASL